MNANDRIALELGRTKLAQIVAEVQLDQAREQIAAQAAEISELNDRVGRTVEETGGSRLESDSGGVSDASSG